MACNMAYSIVYREAVKRKIGLVLDDRYFTQSVHPEERMRLGLPGKRAAVIGAGMAFLAPLAGRGPHGTEENQFSAW
jgi:hypothetical protein